jgi:hypothetical protein
MEIKDNYLDQKSFNEIERLMTMPDFSWFFNNIIDFDEDVDKFQFVHIFYKNSQATSKSIDLLIPILELVQPFVLGRIKANLLTRTSNIIKNQFHIDLADLSNFPEKLKQWTTSIFYVNTNNGYTEFEDGTKVESVANRMITFPSNIKHRGTSCTDEKIRIVINFNYFSKG